MSLRILIVEDDKHVRRILESLIKADAALAPRMPELVIAQDGQEGVDKLEGGKYDLVISDLLMPRLDGFAFARALRRHPAHKGVPLIVTSAIYKDQSTLNRLQQETGAELFAKPFQVQELMAAVRRLLGAPGNVGVGRKTGPIGVRAIPEPAPRAAPVAASIAQAVAAIVTPAPSVATQAGLLADRPPPKLLLDLSEQRVTGVLTLQRAKVRKDVALLSGVPVSVTSNLRTETLGHFLVARGLLDENRHRLALEQAQSSQDRLGRVLVELGWMSEQELLKQLGSQMRAKLTNLLRWKDGTYSFVAGTPPGQELQTPVEMARVVFAGLQKTGHVDEIAPELMILRGRLSPNGRTERCRDPFVRTFGSDGIDALARRPLVEDLLSDRAAQQLLVQIDALLLCGLADLAPGADSAPLEPIVRQPAASAGLNQKNLYDELFGEEISEVRGVPSGVRTDAPAEVALSSLGDDSDDEESGVMQLPTGAEAAAQAVDVAVDRVDPKVEALRKEVLAEYLAVRGEDFYQVLGLANDAGAAEVQAAYAEKQRRFRIERFAGVDLGRDYARVEEIQQIHAAAYGTLSSQAERQKYDRALAARVAPSNLALSADLLAQEAKKLIAEGKYTAAQKKLAEAAAAAPDQADYQALLAWAVFLAEGGRQQGANAQMAKKAAAQAWVHIEQGLAMDTDNAEAHAVAGSIAAAAGDDERALLHLERAIDALPARGELLAAVETIHTRRSDWKRLERQYRKLIHRLGEREPELRVELWHGLGELYRTHIGDAESARVAFEVMAKLAPDDERATESLALVGGGADSWHKRAEPLVEAWRAAPTAAEHGSALFALYTGAQQWDAALMVAGVMAARGLADADASEFLRRHRPRFLVRAAHALSPSWIDRLRHPDDDRDLGTLFALVFGSARPPLTLADLGVTVADRVPSDSLPDPFAHVLGYVAHQLGVPVPPVFRRADGGLTVGALELPVLVAGAQLIGEHDRVVLGFHLARALAFLWPGRAEAGALPGRQLKTTLLATLTLVQPSLPVDDPDGQVASLRARLADSPTLRRDVEPFVDKLIKGPQGTLNLSRYARGLSRTADRVGLLLSGDVQVALSAAEASGVQGAADELLAFALSPALQSARQELGLTIAV